MKKIKITPERKILLTSISISAVLIALALLSDIRGVLGNALILSGFIIVIPILLFRYGKYRTIKEYEERFPSFLRDVIESIRAGSPLHQAMITNSKIDYGKFSDEVKKMASQISWGIPVDRVLGQFTERIKDSKMLYTSVKTIREAYSSGGDVVATLDSVADNMITLDDAEKERKSLLNQYVVLMYAIAFIFVGIVVAINSLMVPIFESANTPGTEEIFGLSNPCEIDVGFPCGIFIAASKYIFNADPSKIGSYYLSVFFYMSIIVSITSGLVAGQISENSVLAGVKHSVIMTTVVFGALLILSQVGLLGIK